MGWNVGREARKHRRVAAEMPVRFRLAYEAESGATYERGTSTNVSYSGLGFVCSRALPINVQLELEVSLPGTLGEVQINGKVVRIVSELPNGRGIEYGVEFSLDTRSEVLEKFVRTIDIVPWLQLMLKRGATDLHFSAFTPAMLRVQRELVSADNRPLSGEIVEAIVMGTLSSVRRRALEREREVDFPLIIPELGRWRVNAQHQRGYVEASFHLIERYTPTLEELCLPEVVGELALSPGGLVLVTGPTGSGKSTTLAAMVDVINDRDAKLIVKLEDPINFVHENRQSVIRQREVGSDTASFARGLRSALRHEADVVVISDLRDFETADMALHAAAAGTLILAGIGTSEPVYTINRIASYYPPGQRGNALHLLSAALRGIVNLKLLKKSDGTGVIPAVEILIANEGIRGAIRTDRLDQIPLLLSSTPGGQSLEVSLRNLVLRGFTDVETALHLAHDPDRLRKMLSEHRS